MNLKIGVAVMRVLKDAEEKILDKALGLIGKNGSSKISIRAIAQEAGVNVSAVNYYFGSKIEMLKRVDEFYLKNTMDTYSALENDSCSDRDKILNWADAVMEYSLRYPGITVLLKEINEREDERAKEISEITQKMNFIMIDILKRVIGGDEETFSMNKNIFISSILHPLTETHKSSYPNEFFDRSAYRQQYISHLLNLITIE